MSRPQKTFWAALVGKHIEVQHLWRVSGFNKDYIESACGLTYAAKAKTRPSKMRRCKNCERAIET